MKNNLISIITPTLNRGHCIERAIQTVKDLRAVAGFDYEHIIIDDGSSDKTEELVNKNKHKKLIFKKLKKNVGVNGARNAGIKLAKGQHLLFFDSDDELLPDSIIKIKWALEKTKRKYKVYFFQTVHYKTGKLMSFTKKPLQTVDYKQRLERKLISGEYIPLVETSAAKKVMFDQKRFAFERFFWNKMSKAFGEQLFVNKVLRKYHDENDDRLCKKLLNPKFSGKRLRDYEYYLQTFGKDYELFELDTPLSDVFFNAGFYAALSGNRKRAKMYFNKSLRLDKNIKKMVALILSYLGKFPFRIIVRITRRNA